MARTETPLLTESALRSWRKSISAFFAGYAVRTVLQALLTIFLVVSFTFFLVRLMPGNPVDIMVNDLMIQRGMDYDQAVAYAISLVGFEIDAPIGEQYLSYLHSLLRLDLGKSLLSTGTPVWAIIAEFLPWTLFCVGSGLLISFLIGMMVGTLAAYRRGGAVDILLSTVSSIISSIPGYLLPTLIILVFGVQLKWIPFADMRGRLSPGMEPALTLAFLGDVLYHAFLPIFTYVLITVGGWMLAMKSSTTATLGEDYVTAAHARGLPEGRILLAYVGRNAALPLFTQLAISIGFVVSGAFLIEHLFQYGGIGSRLLQAVKQRDYPLMQGIFLIVTLSVVLSNLAAEFLYSRLDPRIRVSGEK